MLRGRAGLLRAFEPPDTAVVEYVARVGVVVGWRAVRDRRASWAVSAPTAARTEGRSADELDGQADAYPVANTGLIDRIAGVGAVVSEYPPGASPARHRFLVRIA